MMNNAVIVICSVAIAVPPTVALILIFYGKNKLNKAIRPLEFYPPRGYSPIDVLCGYYGFRAKAHALLNPLMLYWADRGIISIEEDCKRGLKLTKLKEFEMPDGDIKDECERTVNYKTEKKLFDDIFGNGDVFYTLAASGAYDTAQKNFVDLCEKTARDNKSHISKVMSRSIFIGALLVFITVCVVVGISVGGPIYAAMLFPIIGMVACRAIPNDDRTMAVIKYPFFAVWGGAPLCAVIALTPFSGGMLLLAAAVSCGLTVFVFYDKIDIRSEKELDIYGRICAFKKFLLDAEIDRLETLIEENPNYYYDILPFCYVLKITYKLKSKFDRIALDGPGWYLGDLRNTLMF